MSEKVTKISNWHYIRLGVIAALIMIVIGGPTLAHIIADETKTIDMNKFYDIKISGVGSEDIINVDVRVTKGDPVDILLMRSSDYVNYLKAAQSEQNGTFNYFINGSYNSIKSKTYNFTFPESGDYYFVIDYSQPGWVGNSNRRCGCICKNNARGGCTYTNSYHTSSRIPRI